MTLSRVLDILCNIAFILCVLFGGETTGLVAEVLASIICIVCLLGMLNPVFRKAAAAAEEDFTTAMAMLTAVVFLLTDHVVAASLYAIVVAVLAYASEPDLQVHHSA